MQARNPKRKGPTLEVVPKQVGYGGVVHARGSGWPVCPIELAAGERVLRPAVVSEGSELEGGLVPSADGSFECTLLLAGLDDGRHTVVATSAHRSKPDARFTVRV